MTCAWIFSEPEPTYCMFKRHESRPSHCIHWLEHEQDWPFTQNKSTFAAFHSVPGMMQCCRERDALQTRHILTNNLSHSIHNTRENTAGVERSAWNLLSLSNKSTLTSRYIKNISSSIPATGISRLPDGSQRLKATSKERKSPL